MEGVAEILSGTPPYPSLAVDLQAEAADRRPHSGTHYWCDSHTSRSVCLECTQMTVRQ